MKRTISISAINIVMPAPHSAERYINLFLDAYALKLPINLRNDFQGLLGSARLDVTNPNNQIIHGEIYKYFNLRMDSSWFDISTQKPADASDLSEVNVPDHLKPHFKFFPYVFYPKNHKLFLITEDRQDTISIGQAGRFLTDLFGSVSLVQKYGTMNIHIEPARETLDNIFSIPHLRHIYLEVSPPNPDDLDSAERALFERMHMEKAGKMTQTLDAIDSKVGLSPSQETKTLARIAQSNGHVDGAGLDLAGKPVKVSTNSHPLQERVTYNSNLQSRLDVLREKAETMLSIFKRHPGG